MDRAERALTDTAVRAGWRLAWKAEPLRLFPNLVSTTLDIFAGRSLLTPDGPVAVIHGRRETGREAVAGMVLEYLSRRGARHADRAGAQGGVPGTAARSFVSASAAPRQR